MRLPILTRFGQVHCQKSLCKAQVARTRIRSFSVAANEKKKNLDAIAGYKSHVLVRADLNVPLDKSDSSKITDDTRIREFLPTLERLLDEGSKVVVCSHLGRPKGQVNDSMRLDPVAKRMQELLGDRGSIVHTVSDCIGDQVKSAASKLKNGEVLLLENLRFHAEEEKNDPEFAKALKEASMAKVFVNDAFGTAHRAHASTEGVTKFMDVCVAGSLMEKELRFLKGAVDDPVRPMTAILGGAKVSSKLPVIESLMSKCDTILLGGAMIFTFYKARGLDVGKSLVEDSFLEEAKRLEQRALDQGINLILPSDVVIANEMSADAQSSIVGIESIPPESMGLDIGPDTVEKFVNSLSSSKTIVWNGPMGAFEFAPFASGTEAIARAVAECTIKRNAISIIGGGDSVAAVHQAGVAKQISHISTGGGASLEMLEGKTLPGVAALDSV